MLFWNHMSRVCLFNDFKFVSFFGALFPRIKSVRVAVYLRESPLLNLMTFWCNVVQIQKSAAEVVASYSGWLHNFPSFVTPLL